MAARNLPVLNEIELDLSTKNIESLAVQTDVSIESDCRSMIQQAVDRFDEIDILKSIMLVSVCGLFLLMWNSLL